jgi:hypothetical protein
MSIIRNKSDINAKCSFKKITCFKTIDPNGSLNTRTGEPQKYLYLILQLVSNKVKPVESNISYDISIPIKVEYDKKTFEWKILDSPRLDEVEFEISKKD